MRNRILSIVLILVAGLMGSSCAAKKWAPAYGSPEETFRTWKQAIIDENYDVLISCYVEAAQPDMRREIETSSPDGLQSMRDETKRTTFKIEKVVYQENKAFLRVSRTLRGHANDPDIEVVNMLLEKGAWRLAP